MTNEKYLELIDRLVARTRADSAPWETTATNGQFSLSLAAYSVTISRVRSGADWDIVIGIEDSLGNAIDSVRDTDLGESSRMDSSEFYKYMNALYDGVRRHALGIDTALDRVLKALE